MGYCTTVYSNNEGRFRLNESVKPAFLATAAAAVNTALLAARLEKHPDIELEALQLKYYTFIYYSTLHLVCTSINSTCPAYKCS